MTMQLSKRDMRQAAYRQRSSTARGFARMMMPLTLIVFGTAAWKDPELGPKLSEGLEVIRPIAATYLEDTPLEDILGPVAEEDVAAAETLEDGLKVASNLPESRIPVNRP